MGKRLFTNKQALAALAANAGFVSEAAKALTKELGYEISYSTLWARVERNPALKQAYIDVEETRIDFAESKLLKAISRDQAWAICFYLKCKAKHRGYIESSNAVDDTKKIDHLHEILAAFKQGPVPRGHYIGTEGPAV